MTETFPSNQTRPRRDSLTISRGNEAQQNRDGILNIPVQQSASQAQRKQPQNSASPETNRKRPRQQQRSNQNAAQQPSNPQPNVASLQTREVAQPDRAQNSPPSQAYQADDQSLDIESDTPDNRQQEDLAEAFIQKAFLLELVKQNHFITQSQCLQIIGMFGLTSNFSNILKMFAVLKHDDERRLLFQYNSYLTSIRDQETYNRVLRFFGEAFCQFLKAVPYLTDQGCLKFSSWFGQINRNVLDEHFVEKKVDGQLTGKFTLQSLHTIKKSVFSTYQKILSLLSIKKRNGESSPFWQMLMKKGLLGQLIKNVWNSFTNIVEHQQKKTGHSNFSCELNHLLTCLAHCLELDSNFFSLQFTTKQLFPVLKALMFSLGSSTEVHVKNFENLLLKLIFVHPFTISTFNSSQEMETFLKDKFIAKNLSYLYLLSDKIDFDSLQPLRTRQSALFLENYLKLNLEFMYYSNEKQAFVLNSICGIFEDAYTELKSQQQVLPTIFSYIRYIIRSVGNDPIPDDKDEDSYRRDILNAAKLSKLISLVCLGQKGSKKLRYIEQLFQGEQVTLDIFFGKCIEILMIVGYQGRAQFQRWQTFFEDSDVSITTIYELFYKILILQATYFQEPENLLKAEGFDRPNEFYELLFCGYIINFVNKANHYDLNMLAFAAIAQAEKTNQQENGNNPRLVLETILQSLSSLAEQEITILDAQNRQTTRNALQLVAQKMLEIKQKGPKALLAFGDLIVTLLHYSTDLLSNMWVRAMVSSSKKLVENYHVLVLYQYTETIQRILEYFHLRKEYLFNIQEYFELKCINSYLHTALAFQYDRDKSQFFNKFMNCRKYDQVLLAIKLIKSMSLLYLDQKQNQLEAVPFEIKNLLEKENRANDYQLVFAKEATSYAFAIGVILTSNQFTLHPKLNKDYPTFKDEAYDCLINLHKISRSMHFDMNFKIYSLYNRAQQAEMNERFNIQNKLIQSIKNNPTFLNFEFLRCICGDKASYKKGMIVKLASKPTTIQTIESQTRFLLAYWKTMPQHAHKTIITDEWAYLDSFLKKIRNFLKKIDLTKHILILKKALRNIFQLSIFLKKRNLELYTELLINYKQFFIDSKINNLAGVDHFPTINQAMSYVFNIKHFLPSHLFQRFTKDQQFQVSLANYVFHCLQVRDHLNENKRAENQTLFLAELGTACIMDICPQSNVSRSWLLQIFKKVMHIVEIEGDMGLNQIVLLTMLGGKLGNEIPSAQVNLKGDYWQLIANALRPEANVAKALLLDFQTILLRHQVFFVSFCHYFVKLSKTIELSKLLKEDHIKLNNSFMMIIKMLLLESIRQKKSYYIIWIIQIYIEIIFNQQISKQQQFQVYRQIRSLFLTQKVIFNRIHQLLAAIHIKMGLDSSVIQFKTQQSQEKFTISQKLELLTFIKFITFLYFDERLELLKGRSQESIHLQEVEKEISKKFEHFQLLMFKSMPLLSKLLSVGLNQISIETQAERTLSVVKINQFALHPALFNEQGKLNEDELKVRQILGIKSVNEVWSENQTVLSLFNEVLNYQLISTSTVWISLMVQLTQKSVVLHPSLYQDDNLEPTIKKVALFLEAVLKKMDNYKISSIFASQILSQFNICVYKSQVISREMHFTNSKLLSSHIDISFQQVTSKLTEVAIVFIKMLDYLVNQTKVLKNSDSIGYPKIIKQVMPLLSMIESVDPSFAEDVFNLNKKGYSWSKTL